MASTADAYHRAVKTKTQHDKTKRNSNEGLYVQPTACNWYPEGSISEIIMQKSLLVCRKYEQSADE